MSCSSVSEVGRQDLSQTIESEEETDRELRYVSSNELERHDGGDEAVGDVENHCEEGHPGDSNNFHEFVYNDQLNFFLGVACETQSL